jgi:hypothetical protein
LEIVRGNEGDHHGGTEKHGAKTKAIHFSISFAWSFFLRVLRAFVVVPLARKGQCALLYRTQSSGRIFNQREPAGVTIGRRAGIE